MNSRQPSQPPQEPLAEIGREPLHEALADARQERRGGISLQTLGVASAASAAASFTASHLWGPGTVASAALTPVVVALVSEFLRRPVNRVSVTAQRVVPIAPRPSSPGETPPAPPPRPAAEWSPTNYGDDAPRPAWRPRWRLVLVTGLLAFAIVVGFYTIPDLLVGHSITGSGGATTFFSSGGSTPSTPPPTQTQTQTQTQTVTTTVPSTTTAAPPQTTTTATTPLTTDTAPQQTTPTTATTPSAPATLAPSTPGAATTTPTTPTP